MSMSKLLQEVKARPDYKALLKAAKARARGRGMKGDGIAGDIWNFIKKAVEKGVETIKQIGKGVTGLLGQFGLTPGEALAMLADLAGNEKWKKWQKYLDAAAGAAKALEERKKKDEEARGSGIRHPALKASKKLKVPPKGKFPNILAEPNAAVKGEGMPKRRRGRGASTRGDLDEMANDGSKDVVPVKPPNASTVKGDDRGAMSGWSANNLPNAAGMGVPAF